MSSGYYLEILSGGLSDAVDSTVESVLLEISESPDDNGFFVELLSEGSGTVGSNADSVHSYFLEILAESSSSILNDSTTGMSVEVILSHASLTNEMPGPESIEIQTPVSVRSDYAISATEPTDPGVLIWYKII